MGKYRVNILYDSERSRNFDEDHLTDMNNQACGILSGQQTWKYHIVSVYSPIKTIISFRVVCKCWLLEQDAPSVLEHVTVEDAHFKTKPEMLFKNVITNPNRLPREMYPTFLL